MTDEKKQETGLATRTAPTVELVHEPHFQMALEPKDFMQAWTIASYMGSIHYCGVQSAEEAIARIMYGRTLGLSAIASLANVYTINSKPGLEAATMLGICLQRPDVCELFECVSSSATHATWRGKRRGYDKIEEVTWTIEDAKRAGLLGRGEKSEMNNWDRYPEDMCNARAITRIAKRRFPDLVRGFSSVEELRDAVRVGDHVIETQGALTTPAIEKAKLERDVAKEAEEIKAVIRVAVTKELLDGVRLVISNWDGGEPYHSEMKRLYGIAVADYKKAKATPAEAPKAEGAT